MRYIARKIEKEIKQAARAFPALLVTGPRRAGKTTLLKKLFPGSSYYLLEDPDLISRIKADPRAFVEEIKDPCILDEIQNVPELFNYLRTRIDEQPRRFGRWYLTGSQEAPLMQGVSESMAGRVAVFSLLPLCLEETKKVSFFFGGFPEVLARPRSASIWFRSYIQTYLERDVRSISAIKDLSTFRKFLSILASRCGMVLNKTDIAAPLGLSVPALTEWINILEMTGQIMVVPPFYENFGKRLIKSPKIYFTDSGLAAYLLGLETDAALRKSAFLGQLFEGFVASEIIKHQLNTGKRKELYYFRDQQGLEVDFVVPQSAEKIFIIEAKASRSITPGMGRSLTRLDQSISRYKTEKFIIYLDPPQRTKKEIYAVYPGIKALPVSKMSSFWGK